MADLDTIVTNLDRIVVSGKLTTGQATIVLNHVTLRQMLDKILEARDLVEPAVDFEERIGEYGLYATCKRCSEILGEGDRLLWFAVSDGPYCAHCFANDPRRRRDIRQ